MKISATRRLQYAIGHRVFRHEGKCQNLHGHNFVFFLTAEGVEHIDTSTFDQKSSLPIARPSYQDDLGRVIDFGILKAKFDPWFNLNWDHGMVLWEGDDAAIAGVRMVSGSKLFLLDSNPTAENLALYVLQDLGPRLLVETGVRLVKVVVWETENGVAEATL